MNSMIVACLICIVANLGYALLHVFFENDEDSERAAKALTWRVTLSLGLFLVLMVGHYFGWIEGHPLNSRF